jgi:hypothetical protein
MLRIVIPAIAKHVPFLHHPTTNAYAVQNKFIVIAINYGCTAAMQITQSKRIGMEKQNQQNENKWFFHNNYLIDECKTKH